MRFLRKVAGLTLGQGKRLGHVGGTWCQVTAPPKSDELREVAWPIAFIYNALRGLNDP